MCSNPHQKKPASFYFFPIFILFFLIGISCQEKTNQSKMKLSKSQTEYTIKQIPLIVMDTTVLFDTETNEEEVKVTSNVVTSQDYMRQVLGIEPSENDIDSVFQVNPIKNTTDLIIIDHVEQKALEILDFKRTHSK
jgi:hypothetical protein